MSRPCGVVVPAQAAARTFSRSRFERANRSRRVTRGGVGGDGLSPRPLRLDDGAGTLRRQDELLDDGVVAAWLAAVAGGDGDALAVLYGQTSGQLMAVLLRLLRRHEL